MAEFTAEEQEFLKATVADAIKESHRLAVVEVCTVEIRAAKSTYDQAVFASQKKRDAAIAALEG